MNFKTILNYQGEEKTVIIPLFHNDNLKENLQKIALKYSIHTEELGNDFVADLKTFQTFYTSKNKIILLGLGKKYAQKDVILAFRLFFHKHKNNLKGNIGIECQDFDAEQIEMFVNGIVLGGYDTQFHKTDKKEDENWYKNEADIVFYTTQNIEKSIERGIKIATSQANVMQLVDEAPNFLTPKRLAEWAIHSGKENNYEVTILDKKDLKEKGLNLLLAVGNVGRHEPKLIIAEYKPQNYTKTIGLVGKGITFDNGGVSLKNSTNMHFMKCDMAGAAAVLGITELVAKLQLPIHLITIVPAAENLLGNESYLPSDVFTSYSGKTIEIIDTDAEGRLILADALSYLCKNFDTDILIDLATLTGSVVNTFGYVAAGYFTNNEDLAQKLYQSGQKTGEKLWRLPLWDDYKDDISSDIADLRNFSGKPIAGSISAAKFLEAFTENHSQYAHLDIAGVSFGDSPFANVRTATGYGVRLLLDYIENL
jgi:leucyl aminopeptidase